MNMKDIKFFFIYFIIFIPTPRFPKLKRKILKARDDTISVEIGDISEAPH
jgi:hypothetical protein